MIRRPQFTSSAETAGGSVSHLPWPVENRFEPRSRLVTRFAIMTPMKNSALEYLKAFAVLCVLNSHLDDLYGPYEILGTGGAVGLAFFFFCSGYGLFLGQQRPFFDYMKRRIVRIYPSVWTCCILGTFIFGIPFTIRDAILAPAWWFVSFIMIFYVLIYWIRRFLFRHLKFLIGALWLTVVILFFFQDATGRTEMYFGTTATGRLTYFSILLWGAFLGSRQSSLDLKFNFKLDALKFIISLLAYYTLLFLDTRFEIVNRSLICSLPFFLAMIFYLYKITSGDVMKRLYEKPILGRPVSFLAILAVFLTAAGLRYATRGLVSIFQTTSFRPES